MSNADALRRCAYVGQSALRGILAGLLLGVVLGATGTAASVAGRPELRGSAGEMLGLTVGAGGLALGFLGGILGAVAGLSLAVRGKDVAVQRLSALYLIVAVAALPPGLALSGLSLLQSTSFGGGVLAAAAIGGLAALAVGIATAIALHHWVRQMVARLGAAEGRLVTLTTPSLLLASVLSIVISITSSLADEASDGHPVGLLPARPAVTPTDSADNLPNVLLITVDTLRADRLGSYGNAGAQTPHLDQLAAGGARFEWPFVQQPQTNAQHASIFTGLYPGVHGVRAHMVDRLSESFPTLAETLRGAGYATAGIYSWISLEPAFSGLQRGFDSYQGYVLNRPETLADGRLQYLAASLRRLKEYLAVVRTADLVLGASGGLEDQIDGRADVTTDAALEWLQGEGRDRPFFLWIHYFDPHYPYAPPPPYDRAYDPEYDGTLDGSMATIRSIYAGSAIVERDRRHLVALYDGEIAYLDTQIGRLLEALAEEGRLDNTIVVLTGDHGESFAEHDSWFHPGTLYNTEIRVPLVIRYPPTVARGVVVTAPVQGIDVMPTILDLTGLATPTTVQGRSLTPLLAGREDRGERAAFSQLPDDRTIAIVRGDWKLILHRASGRTELYHLASDPDEMGDLSDEQPDVALDLEIRLRRWMTEQGAIR